MTRFLLLVAIILCSIHSDEFVQASDLFITIHNLEVNMGNSQINATFNANSRLQSLFKNGKNLLNTVANGASGYVDWDGGKGHFEPSNLSLVEQTDSLIHIMYSAAGSTDRLAIELHLILFSNVSSIYHYIKASNPSTKELSLAEFRTVHRFDVSLMPQGSNGVRLATPPLQSVLDQRPMIQDSTWQLEDGTYYTKYEFANYIYETPWFGVFGGGFGTWLISPSREYHTGGPLKQDLLIHQNALISNYLTSTHFGSANLNASSGWSKFYGPWLLYFNEGSDQELLEDVSRQTEIEQAQWPYSWVKDDEYPLRRGSLSGRITGQPRAQIVLYSSLTEQFDLQTQGYSYNAKTDDDGGFIIKNIRPGQYRMVAYPLAGQGSENLAEKTINITEG